MNPLSLATTYIETYYISADNGELKLRSYATGFFLRGAVKVYLVTNWHVVSGLNPANPATIEGNNPPPNYMKITVRSKEDSLVELTLPLYDEQMRPLWREHIQRYSVDMVVYLLPLSLAECFHLVDISTVTFGKDIDVSIAKDVFLLGYPFTQQEMKSSFGEHTPYYLPLWKRGTIASEPSIRLSEKVILIDALSRPGMSGAPVLVSEEHEVLRLVGANAKIWRDLEDGASSALAAISALDTSQMSGGLEKRFKLLGVYSGVIGNTRLGQIALGKCWHVDALHELILNHQPGEMPHHNPFPNHFYTQFLSEFGVGQLTHKDAQGLVTKVVQLS